MVSIETSTVDVLSDHDALAHCAVSEETQVAEEQALGKRTLRALLSTWVLPGKPAAYNSELLWFIYGLLWGIVACCFGLLGVPGKTCCARLCLTTGQLWGLVACFVELLGFPHLQV